MKDSEKEILKTTSISMCDITDEFFDIAMTNKVLACDTETTGLKWKENSIQTVQLYIPNQVLQIVKISHTPPSKIIELIKNPKIQIIFHHAMFDLRFMYYHWKVYASNVSCTKIASKILNPNIKQHNLKFLLKEKLDILINKDLATSDWSKKELNEQQILYAAKDVFYLPNLFAVLESELENINKLELVRSCFNHIPTRVVLDVDSYGDIYTY